MHLTMSWPQYRRRQCQIAGHVIQLTRREADILLILLLRQGFPTTTEQLVDMLHGGDPDGGPLTCRNIVQVMIKRIRWKIGQNRIIGRTRFGYELVQPSPRNVPHCYLL